MKLICKQGHNLFMPQIPVWPHCGKELHFEIQLGPEWWESPLTFPADGFGMKFAIGKFNYHMGGISFGFINRENKMYVFPRYYESIIKKPYIPHELDNLKVEMDQGMHHGVLKTDPLEWWWDGELIHSVPGVSVPCGWYASPFIGRSGRDTGFNTNNPPAFARQKLTMNLIRK